MMSEQKIPPDRSSGILSDIRFFLLHKPPIPTLISCRTEEERENFTQRILQRLEISVTDYSVLNIHKIGIEAPVRYVFEELLNWDGDSTCWPNFIARVERMRGKIEHIRIFLLGKKKYPFAFKKSFFGLKYIPLFEIKAIKIQHLPDPADVDNARYLLYNCRGGYPIGIFSVYARSSIAQQQEKEQTQLFFVVSFNFYGRAAPAPFKGEPKDGQERKVSLFNKLFRDTTGRKAAPAPYNKIQGDDQKRKTGFISRFFQGIRNRIWEKIHDRVTANVLNRFKQLCEWRFEKVQEEFLQAE